MWCDRKSVRAAVRAVSEAFFARQPGAILAQYGLDQCLEPVGKAGPADMACVDCNDKLPNAGRVALRRQKMRVAS